MGRLRIYKCKIVTASDTTQDSSVHTTEWLKIQKEINVTTTNYSEILQEKNFKKFHFGIDIMKYIKV